MTVGCALRVTVFGGGYVGAVSAIVLAAVGHEVTCVEPSAARLARWQAGEDPLEEPGLASLLARSGVRFLAEPNGIAEADVIIIAVGTPMDREGRPELSQVEAVVDEISRVAKDGATVLMRSTVPVGTCDRLQRGALRRLRVVSNPEFLREGRALQDSFSPDRIVAGGPPDARGIVERLYRRIIDGTDLPVAITSPRPVPLLWMSARSAELAKYAANGFLATKLSFVNEIANVAQAVGADPLAVLDSMALDPRIGKHFLRPGLGWGGSCFPKDTRAFEAIANGSGYDFVVLRAAIEQNERQLYRFAQSIISAVAVGGRIGLLGLAFKAGTSDTRESPALALARALIAAGLELSAYDPAVRVVPADVHLTMSSSALAACACADAVVIATEWPEFADLDLAAVRAVTRGDLLFDGRSMVTPMRAAQAGFRHRGVSGTGD